MITEKLDFLADRLNDPSEGIKDKNTRRIVRELIRTFKHSGDDPEIDNLFAAQNVLTEKINSLEKRISELESPSSNKPANNFNGGKANVIKFAKEKFGQAWADEKVEDLEGKSIELRDALATEFDNCHRLQDDPRYIGEASDSDHADAIVCDDQPYDFMRGSSAGGSVSENAQWHKNPGKKLGM